MKNIFIVGGNGFAKECYCYVKMLEKSGDVLFGGFFGHGGYGDTVDYKELQSFYLGEVSEYKFLDEDYCVIGAGYPELREKIYNDLKNMGCKFYNLIHPQSTILDFVEMGEANIFVTRTDVSINAKIGNGNVFNGNVIIAHDVKIGDFNFFGPNSQVLGNAKVGNSNSVGANAILLPDSKVGDNNKIAPLSAVYKGCKSNCYMLGNPALKVSDCD